MPGDTWPKICARSSKLTFTPRSLNTGSGSTSFAATSRTGLSTLFTWSSTLTSPFDATSNDDGPIGPDDGPCSSPTSPGAEPHAASATRESACRVDPNACRPRSTSTAGSRSRLSCGAAAPPDGTVTEAPVASFRRTA